MGNSRPSANMAQTTPGRFVGGFPDRMRVVLRYAEQVSMTATSGVNTSYNFRGNSCFDPNFTGTGLQPVNFDDWAGQYNFYKVHGSTFRMMQSGNSVTVGNIIGTVTVNPTKVTTSIGLANSMAQPYALVTRSLIYNSALYGKWQSSSMSSMKILGLKGAQYDGNEDIGAAVNANPAKQWYWQVNFGPDDGTTTSTLLLNVQIDYDVEFYDRVDSALDVSALERQLTLLSNKLLVARDAKVAASKSHDGEAGGPPIETSPISRADWIRVHDTLVPATPPSLPRSSTERSEAKSAKRVR